mgnify:FL=1
MAFKRKLKFMSALSGCCVLVSTPIVATSCSSASEIFSSEISYDGPTDNYVLITSSSKEVTNVQFSCTFKNKEGKQIKDDSVEWLCEIPTEIQGFVSFDSEKGILKVDGPNCTIDPSSNKQYSIDVRAQSTKTKLSDDHMQIAEINLYITNSWETPATLEITPSQQAISVSPRDEGTEQKITFTPNFKNVFGYTVGDPTDVTWNASSITKNGETIAMPSWIKDSTGTENQKIITIQDSTVPRDSFGLYNLTINAECTTISEITKSITVGINVKDVSENKLIFLDDSEIKLSPNIKINDFCFQRDEELMQDVLKFKKSDGTDLVLTHTQAKQIRYINVTNVGDKETDQIKIGDNFLFSLDNLEYANFNIDKDLNITQVGDNFMWVCTNLKYIELDVLKNVKKFGKNFIAHCKNVEYVYLADVTTKMKVQEIGEQFLANDESLRYLDLSCCPDLWPDDTIGTEFLWGCYNLTYINFGTIRSASIADDDYAMACSYKDKPCVTPGITIEGEHKNNIADKFPNSLSTSPYRRLIVGK